MSKTKKGLSTNIKLLIVAILAVALVISVAIFVTAAQKQLPQKPRTYEVDTGGKPLRVGVFSDTQLPENEEKEKENNGLYKEHVIKTFEFLKEQDVDVILMAGDICDYASDYAYKTYTDARDSVFPPDSKDTPLFVEIMGNHDYWTEWDYETTLPKQRVFRKGMGKAPWDHLVVNGFHFIGVSPSAGAYDKAHDDVLDWMDERIQFGVDNAKFDGAPVFVMTHFHPADTVYGSEDWGDKKVEAVLKKHPEVVSISGHSHFSILDERSIYQDEMTALGTQSISYTELEVGKFNAFEKYSKIRETPLDKRDDKIMKATENTSMPPNRAVNPSAFIMNIGNDDITVERWNILEKKEEKRDQRWVVTFPLAVTNALYKPSVVAEKRVAPVFARDVKIAFNPAVKAYTESMREEGITLQGITFTQAKHDDFVHSYELVLTNTTTGHTEKYLYFSDFSAGIGNMADEFNLPLDPVLASGHYKADVYAIESFGKKSTPVSVEFDYTQIEIPEKLKDK